jgi:hypothetical protein
MQRAVFAVFALRAFAFLRDFVVQTPHAAGISAARLNPAQDCR